MVNSVREPGTSFWARGARFFDGYAPFASALLFGAIALAPLPFGSRDPAAIAFWCVWLGVALAMSPMRGVGRGHAAVIAGMGLIACAFAVVLHEQLALRPWWAQPNPVWANASRALGEDLPPSVSVARYEPFYSLGPTLMALAVATLGVIVGSDRRRARQAFRVAAWSGLGYVAYGIISVFADPAFILWRERVSYVGNATATFINRNTAAVYFGVVATIWLLLLAGKIRRLAPSGAIRWKRLPATLVSRPRPDIAIAFACLLASLVALFMSGSRGGVIVSLAVITTTFVIYFRRDLTGRSDFLVALAAAAVVALFMLEIFGGTVSVHFDQQGLSSEGRLGTYRSILRMIAAHPWFGSGLGAFRWSFPPYRSPTVSAWGVWDIGHSTPLEMAADVGLPLTGLVAGAWLVGLAILVRAVRRDRRGSTTVLAALAVAAIGLLHSMIDFSLQVPGYALVTFALVGVGLGQALRGPGESSRSGRRSAEPDNDNGFDEGP